MKKMTCKQLGGACDFEFLGESFDEMQKRMQTPSDFSNWFESKKEEFNNLSNM